MNKLKQIVNLTIDVPKNKNGWKYINLYPPRKIETYDESITKANLRLYNHFSPIFN